MNTFPKKTTPRVVKFADVGAGEPFVARIVMGLTEILDKTDYKNKDDIYAAIMEMFVNGLMPAFAHLKDIRELEQKQDRLEIDVKKSYFAFYDRLWAAYKDRMQKVITVMGYDVKLLFCRQENFEKESKLFQDRYPKVTSHFHVFVKNNRNAWQDAVASYRNNYLQHNSLYDNDVKDMMTLKSAEICFENCWIAIEEIIVEFICLKLWDIVGVAEIPETKRDISMPKRFEIVYNINCDIKNE